MGNNINNINNAERAEASGIRAAVVSLSNSGERATIHVDRAVASEVAILLRNHARIRNWGIQQLVDELDRTLTASAQPASVSNRPLIPYFPKEGTDGGG